MARLYANENFPYPVVDELRRLGHDILTIQETGKAGIAIPDEAVLAFAVNEERILLTLNPKHFIHLHNSHPGHSGIVVCTFDPDFKNQAQRIDNTITSATTAGQLIRINRPQK